MSHYDYTKSRVLQWLGIILIIGVFAGAYWYFQVRASTLNQSQNDSLTNGLVGFWSFNGDDISGTTAYDRSGSGNNGTLTNSPGKVTGKVGQALNIFPGGSDVNAYVNMGDPGSGALDFGSGDFSIGFWMKGLGFLDQTSSANVPLCKKALDTGTSAGYCFSYASTNLLTFSVGNGSTSYPITQTVSTVADNQWHQYVGLRSSNTIYLYVDGALVASTAVSGSFSNSDDLNVGTDRGATSRNAKATFDEVRMYSRALSVTEIQSLYTQGGGTKVNSAVSNPEGTGRLDSGLAAYWKMDDGSGTSATDSSVNGNTGTLTNGPTWGTGQIGGATVFDGTNDYISTAVTIPSRGTVSAWVNPTINLSTSTEYEIFSQLIGGNIFRLEANTYSSNNGYLFTYRGAYGTQIDIFSPAYTSDAQIQGWHHIVASWDTALGSKMYIDGTLVASSTTTTNAFDAMTFNIGKTTVSGYWKGSLDEARVYDRVLSADEVSQLYRLTTPMAVDTGLKGYWSFDGQDMNGTAAYDRSGAGNTGTLTNGPTRTLGKIGQALSFDGTNDTVIAGTASAPVTAAPLTACLWMYPTDVSTNYRIPWSMMKNNGLASGWYLSLDNTGSVGFTAADTNTYASTPTQKIAANTWTHVCGVEASSSSRSLYVNGVLVGTDTNSKVPTGVDQMYIGDWRRDSDTFFFQGKLDEVRVYNRALSAAEIQGLYSAGGGDKMNSSVSQNQGTGRLDSSLAGYWKMDDGSGTSATDSSPNGNTGTLTNGPTWGTGQVGGDTVFDGTNDYINVGDVAAAEFGSDSFTYAGWVNASALPSASSRRFIATKGDSGGYEWEVSLSGYFSPAKFQTAMYAGGGTTYITTNSTTTPSTSQWYHVVSVFNKSVPSITIYVNGVKESVSTTTSGSLNSGTVASLQFGRRGDGAEQTWSGALDEQRLYRRALSDDEVVQLYRLTTPTGVDTSLKGYWSFNGQDTNGTTAYDRSGSGNNGTLTNGPVKAIGKIGQALSFDGTDDYVTIADNAALKPTTALSYGGWVYVPSTPGGLKTIMEKGTATTAGYGLYVTTDPKFCFIIKTAGGTETDASPAMTTGMWHHVMVTYDSTTPLLYVDGVSQTLASGTSCTASTNTGAITQDTGTLTFGSRQGSSQFLTGKVDELRVYNRALSTDEVAALYNQSR